jgi:hypothetical protein
MAYTKATKDGKLPAIGGAITVKGPAVGTFDLSKVNVVELASSLSQHLSRPQSAGWLSRWWQDRKLPKDNERVMMLQQYVDNLIKTHDSITNMQYKLFIQPEVLNHFIVGNRLRMEQEIERLVKQHEDDMRRIDDENEMRKAQVEKLKAEIEKMQAEALQMKASAWIIQLQGTLLNRIINEVDLSNISLQQAFVLVKALNPMAGKDIDLATQQLMVEGELEKAKAETEVLRAQAKQEATKAQHEAWKFKQDKKDLP